jgi:hypothetical protein
MLNTSILNCWQIEHSIYKDAFARNGYKEISKSVPLMARIITGKDIVPDPSKWWFALGDNDVY